MTSRTSPVFRSLIVPVAVAGLCTASVATAQGGFFDPPFVVEHHLVQVDERGDRFAAPPVVDTYGGSWIVSQRADGSRVVVDLARREITEIHAERGTYSTVGFERLAEVMKRVAELEGTRPESTEAPYKTLGERRSAADWQIREGNTQASLVTKSVAGTSPLLRGKNVRYLRIEARDGSAKASVGHADGGEAGSVAAEVWVDPSIRINASARSAIADFERSALGTEGLMEAAREFVDGAIPVHTVRAASKSGDRQVEDVVTRLEKLERFDRSLIAVPEGSRRVPHPLEGLMAYLEKEEERIRIMSGVRSEAPQSFVNVGTGGND